MESGEWRVTSSLPIIISLSTFHASLFTMRFTTAGESHGPSLLSILEGLPAGVPVSAEDINRELERRQQG